MALTPEDVLNKTFTQTQFRRGYDEREVGQLEHRNAELESQSAQAVQQAEQLQARNAELEGTVGELESRASQAEERAGELEGQLDETRSQLSALVGEREQEQADRAA